MRWAVLSLALIASTWVGCVVDQVVGLSISEEDGGSDSGTGSDGGDGRDGGDDRDGGENELDGGDHLRHGVGQSVECPPCEPLFPCLWEGTDGGCWQVPIDTAG